jgi:hypothetical protein
VKAPDLKILDDNSFLDIGYRGAHDGLSVFWLDVVAGDMYNTTYGIQTGHRLILMTNCCIINVPVIAPGDNPCDYAWTIPHSMGTLNPVSGKYNYPSMLEVLEWQRGTIVNRIIKSSYDFSNDCRSDHPNCASCVENPDAESIPAFAGDFYYFYYDITDRIPQPGQPPVYFVLTPKINYAGQWIEQNLNNNDVVLALRVNSDQTVMFDDAALAQLIPAAPKNFTYQWDHNHVHLWWDGNAEWYEVKKSDGVIRRVMSTMYDDGHPTGKTETYFVRSGNRYRASDWVIFIATKK